MRCHILTAVWGPWHTDRFINVNLPSLLAANNLPEFSRRIVPTYVIATSKSDAGLIAASQAYRLLQNIMRVQIVTYRDSAFREPISTHKKIWQKGVRDAARSKAYLMVNPADMVWADGSFRTVAERLASGKKAIYALFARVLDETFTREASALRGQEGAITIAPRTMIDMTLRHLHPFHAAYLRDSDQFPFHVEYVYWPVHGEGLLMRSLATTVLAFDPAECDVNFNFTLESMRNPRDLDMIDDSDDLCGVSLTPLKKDQNWYAAFQRLDIEEVGAWWLTFDGAAHLPLAKTRFLFHTGGRDSSAWQRAKGMSDFFVLQALISREIIRVGRLLKKNHCNIFAEILATALYAGRIRRQWHWSPPLSFVVPNDEALKPYRRDIVDRLLTPGHEKELVGFIFDHVFRCQSTLVQKCQGASEAATATDDRIVSVNGPSLAIRKARAGMTIGGRNVLSRSDLPLGNQLFVVDGTLPPASLSGRLQHIAA